MNTRRAIGSYAVNATEAQKVNALKAAIHEAVWELMAEQGWTAQDVADHCEEMIQMVSDEV